MHTTLKQKSRHTHSTEAPAATPPSLANRQIFQLNLETILSAHLYGHINEAYTLRAIARAIQEFLI